ncbi:hypothetical protein NADFUDRAFT_49431 [Nadsonia fulvescens var. elongata DSM 6958]|uniref:EKC/KEOPS complex subunit BUD32 n=1 Tax=Nadsonia fulvescens var. elongata DSM 6958 TaxID=857566 RepID=A0A1E3PNH0_9ASCO|nr:hypothetical protein NADFUDRAFT_49431 [Nadsonia fulvescens var. elongata DSM 6958]
MAENIIKQAHAYTANIPLALISQGAEALVFTSPVHPYLPSPPTCAPDYILKYRPPKPYRHPVLDAQLTKHRTLSEARLLHKLALLDIPAPRVIHVNPKHGLLWMNNVAGPHGFSVKQWVWDIELATAPNSALRESVMKANMLQIGALIAKLHLNDIVHGDLTTSNIMIRPKMAAADASVPVPPHNILNPNLEPVLIDFGLGSHSALAEDKAVDIYVLERAVESTHPVNSETYKTWLLDGYVQEYERGGKGGKIRIKEVLRKLDEVRQRGRKRSMVG